MMTVQMTPINGPHQGQPILTAGDPLDRARAAMVMTHGRGAPSGPINPPLSPTRPP